MQTKEKIAELGKLLVTAIHERRNWREEDIFSQLDYYCRTVIGLVAAIFKFDRSILDSVFSEFRADYSRFDFSKFDTFDKLREKDKILSEDGAVIIWDELLKAIGLTKRKNNFARRFSEWNQNVKSFKERPTDRKYARLFFDASDVFVREIEYALLDRLHSLAKNHEHFCSDQLAELLWTLEEIRWVFLKREEASGPYILYAGKDWGAGLDDSSLDGHFGILSVNPHSVKPLSREPKYEVKCNFKCRVGDKLLTLSWVMSERFNSERLFQTWVYDSGSYCEYPDTELKAYWPLSFSSEVYHWCEGLREVTLPLLEMSKRYMELAKRVRDTLKVYDYLWPETHHFCWTTIHELDVMILEIKSEMRGGCQERSEALRGALGFNEGRQRAKMKLNATQELIVSALGKDKLTGEEIAKEAKCKFNSNFKTALSALRVTRVLYNDFPQGYYLNPQYYHLLEQLD